MTNLSTETGMRFERFTDEYGVKLRWLSNNEKTYISKWSWRGKQADEKCEEKLGQIGWVCDGYTVHDYKLEDGRWKYDGTTLASTMRMKELENE